MNKKVNRPGYTFKYVHVKSMRKQVRLEDFFSLCEIISFIGLNKTLPLFADSHTLVTVPLFLNTHSFIHMAIFFLVTLY